MSRREEKFRPYLSLPQIHYLVSLAESDMREETQTLKKQIIASLKTLLIKADAGLVTSQYQTKGKLSIAEKLDLETLTPEQKREAAYMTWQASPQFVSAEDMKLVSLYRYENNLMTPEEEAEYENSL